MNKRSNQRIAIFVSFSGKGGVERMMANLSEGLLSLGCDVDMVVVKTVSEHLTSVPSRVRVVKLGSAHTMGSLPALIRYLRRERPAALLAAKDRANQVAILARHMSGMKTRVVVRMGTTVTAALEGKSLASHWRWYLPMRLVYPFADGIIAVSQGVADDLSRITGLPHSRMRVIANPVITPRLAALASEPVFHPWLDQPRVPVVMGVGRLTRQKDFPTLIKAFSLLRLRRPCRLAILGEGRDRPKLESLACELGVKNDVDLPGFVDNPYAFMSRAALFVLSSAWEGSPNALTESLALGIPVVATDCPSGPREILEQGRYGPLVPVGDVRALAEAMEQTLAAPPDSVFLKRAISEYTVDSSSKKYLETLLGPDR